MRKMFFDLGCREGDAVAAFLGDAKKPYSGMFLPRPDAADYEIYGFESPTYPGLGDTVDRFPRVNFRVLPTLAWTHHGEVSFLTDGNSEMSRIASGDLDQWPKIANASFQRVPCIDFAAYLITRVADWIVVKIDIEGAEYALLRHMIDTGAIDKINELYVEFHDWGGVEMREDIERDILDRVARNGLYYRNDWP